MFFDDYPRFLETSPIFAQRERLNLRYEALFAANRDIIQGARILDLASHDGRWSFAALRTGAAHVTGIEARQFFVDNTRETFSHYGEDPDSYRFICGDIFDVLNREKFDVDVVLCLGYLYHTYRHTELLHHIRDMDPECVIIDCNVMPQVQQPYVKMVVDRPDKLGQASLDAYSYAGQTLVGLPSVPALRMMLQAYDFEVEDAYDLDAARAAHKLRAYAEGKRVIMRCRSGASMIPPAEVSAAPAFQGAPVQQSSEYSHGSWAGNPRSRQIPAGPPRSLNGSRWRVLANRWLAKATGYELRRAPRSRQN